MLADVAYHIAADLACVRAVRVSAEDAEHEDLLAGKLCEQILVAHIEARLEAPEADDDVLALDRLARLADAVPNAQLVELRAYGIGNLLSIARAGRDCNRDVVGHGGSSLRSWQIAEIILRRHARGLLYPQRPRREIGERAL